MVDAFSVVPEQLQTDADTWTAWGERLTAISGSVPTFAAGLDPLAFSILPGSSDVVRAYGRASTALVDSVDDGFDQFSGIANKLTAVAAVYTAAEEQNLADISAAESE